MREGAEDGGEGGVPGDSPVPMRLDEFRGFSLPDGEIKVPDGRGGPILGKSGEESGEDDIKVDRRPRKDMLPLRYRKRRKGAGRLEGPERMLEVCGVVLDHGAGAFEILRESGRRDELVDLPCIE